MRALTPGLLVTLLVTAAGATAATAPDDARSVAAAPVLQDRYPVRETGFPGGVRGLPDLVYLTLPGFRPLTLDLYLPAGPAGTARPLLVYIHGGGWSAGHARHAAAFENWPGTLASIAARGYVVASLNYRLSGEAPFPAALLDVKSALRWLRSRASDYGIDRQRAIVWGGSAGGQLAAVVATSCGEAKLVPPAPAPAESDCVQGAVLWYPVTDFEALMPATGAAPGAPSAYLGCGRGTCAAETLRLASAARQVGASTPPVLMIHGSDDTTVPVSQSVMLDSALKKAGVRSELLVIPGVNHSFIGATPEQTRTAHLRALDRSLAFIDALAQQPR